MSRITISKEAIHIDIFLENVDQLNISEISEDAVMIISDMLIGFTRSGPLASKRVEEIIENVRALAVKAKERGIRIVALNDSHSPSDTEFSTYPPHCMTGTVEANIVPELADLIDVTIEKNSTNGMFALLEKHQDDILTAKNIIVCGCCTDICVMHLALTLKAYKNEQSVPSRIVVPIDAVETFDAPGHGAETMNLLALKLMQNEGIEICSEII